MTDLGAITIYTTLYIVLTVSLTGWLYYRRSQLLSEALGAIYRVYFKRTLKIRLSLLLLCLLTIGVIVGMGRPLAGLFAAIGYMVLLGLFDYAAMRQVVALLEWIPIGPATLPTDRFSYKVRAWMAQAIFPEFSKFIRSAFKGVFFIADGQITEVNRSGLKLFGYQVEQLIGRNFATLFASTPALDHLKRALDQEASIENLVIKGIRENRSVFFARLNAKTFAFDGQKVTVVTVSDITAYKAVEAKLNYDTRHDPLNGLANRILLAEHLEVALKHYQSMPNEGFGLLFIDFDHFRQINDSLDYVISDQWLIRVAEKLKKISNPGDTLAWLNHTCFALLMRGVNRPRDLVHRVREIKQQFESPVLVQGYHLIITCCFGGVLPLGKEALSATRLLQWANIASAEAKKLGAGRLKLFDTRMLKRSLSRLEMQNNLLIALLDDEFTIYFQPLYNIQVEGKPIYAFEALARWFRPDGQAVNPAEFIEIAEESGVIHSLGEHLIKKACQMFLMFMETRPAHMPVWLSINLSGVQFAQPNWLSVIRRILMETNFPPGQLKLEITETSIMKDFEASIKKLHLLKKMGVNISIDDFGMGYSSLTYLLKIPADEVKIDKSFIEDLENNERTRSIVRAIIVIAKSCHMLVVAEGVETEAQCRILKELGCDRIQGYFLSRPLPFEQLAALYASTKTA